MNKYIYIIISVLIIAGLGFYFKDQILVRKNKPEINQPGAIKGYVSYPSEGVPSQTVCAEDTRNTTIKFCTDTILGKSGYKDEFILQVPAGKYYVYASLKSQMGDIPTTYKAYYNQFVLCDFDVKCDDSAHHKSLIVVKVQLNSTVENIKPQDWYLRIK